MGSHVILEDLPVATQSDPLFQELPRLADMGVIGKQDIPDLLVAGIDDVYLVLNHMARGNMHDDGFFGFFDFSGKVAPKIPPELREDSGWYPYNHKHIGAITEIFNDFWSMQAL